MRNAGTIAAILLLAVIMVSAAGCTKNYEVEKHDAGLTFSQKGDGTEVEIVGETEFEVKEVKEVEIAGEAALEVASAVKEEADETGTEEEPEMTEEETKEEEAAGSAIEGLELPPGLYAVIETSMGRIVCELFEDRAPIGVENFVGLAEGTKEFTDPKTGQKTKRRYYDGLIFHRVIDGFMIQGGDPLGTGRGGPGYEFKNEVHPDLLYDRPGRLAYANRGPDTNGSQFFITHVPTPQLNGGYTIFGQTVDGQDVVDAIGKVAKGGPRGETPVEPVVIKKINVVRIQ